MTDLISRQAAIDAARDWYEGLICGSFKGLEKRLQALPSAQPEYEPVTAEDFAKIMSEITPYDFVAWHSEAFTLMERQGFVICKKTM